MSGPLDNRPTQADDDLRAALDTVNDMDLQPFDPDAPGAFTGFGESFKSLLRKSAGMGRTAMMMGAPIAQGLDAIANTNPNRPASEATAWQDSYFGAVDEFGMNAVEAWTPDPLTMGSAARTMNTVNTVIGSIPSMFIPSAFLADTAVDPAIDLVRQGVDAKTAGAVGAVNLAANAIGMRIPAAWGTSLATRLATGAGSNLGLGVATDAASAAALRAGGYSEQADGFGPLNAQARGMDVLMGLAFGARAQVDAPRVTPSQRDALLTRANADSFQRTSMPGEPAAAGADLRHQEALDASIRSLLNGEQVDVSATLRAEDFTLRPELRQAVGVQLRGGMKPADVQADYAALGAKHGFRTTSTTRTKAENDKVGGVENSQHLDSRGTARDWSVKGKTQAEIDAFVSDLRAAGFEVITKPHGTGPHVHAELPKGGRKPVERAKAEATAVRADDVLFTPRPTIEALRTAAEAFPQPPPRATVEEYAAWMTGRQRHAATELHREGRGLETGAEVPGPARDFTADSEVVQMAHARWTAQQEGGRVDPLPVNGDLMTVPAMKGDQLVRRSATLVDGVPVAQIGMRFSALEDTGFGYYVTAERRHATAREAAAAAPVHSRTPIETGAADPRVREGEASQPEGRPAPHPHRVLQGSHAAAESHAAGPGAATGPAARLSATPAGTPRIEGNAQAPMQAARAVLANQPDLRVPTGEIDANGNPITVTAGELLAMAERDVQRARLDGEALTAAANCFLRTGT